MKTIITFIMLFCGLTAFAQSVNPSYTGELKISVNGGNTDVISGQTITALDNGGTVTLSIPNFTYAGLTGTVTIIADKDVNGVLSNPEVSFKSMDVFADFSSTSFVKGSSCEIHLSLFVLIETIDVDFVSAK